MLPNPVPPLATDNAVPSVNPAKVGEEEVAIPWIVLTAPFVTVKLVELNEAKPLTVELASWIVIVPPAVMMLEAVMDVIVMAPVWALTLETPELPPPPVVKQVGQVKLPAESMAIGPVAETAMVPLAFGITMDLLEPDGVVKLRVLV